MKNISTIILTICAFALSVIGFNSCNSNPCKDVICRNNGTCREGKCACPSGYEGPFCAAKVSDKFIGYYDGFIRKNGDAPVNVTMIFAPGTLPTQILMYDLYKTYITNPILGNVKEVVKFDIPNQQLATNTYYGNGYVETEKYIYIWYQNTTAAGVLETYYFEGTKRLKP